MELPNFDKVYFLHYQYHRDSRKIMDLCIYYNGNMKIYDAVNSSAFEEYSRKIEELNEKDLIPIHWNQNSDDYGPEHIAHEYFKMTGKQISLQYSHGINLSDYFISLHGDDYVEHRRLDSLAILNNFSGHISEFDEPGFSQRRALLIVKIYRRYLDGILKTDIGKLRQVSKLLSKPTFDSLIISDLLRYLNIFFSEEDHPALRRLIETGKSNKTALIFNASGSRLADAFKQLFEADLIIGCQKKDLEAWVAKNFNFLHRGTIKEFSLKYLNDIISTKKDKCKQPIFDAILDKQTDSYYLKKL